MPAPDVFQPSANSTVSVSVGVASAYTNLPANGEYLELQNPGAVTIQVELAHPVTGPAAVVATSYPVLPGQSKMIRRTGFEGITTISASASQTLLVSAGNGQ